MNKLTRIRIHNDNAIPHLQWAHDLTISLPRTFTSHLYAQGKLTNPNVLVLNKTFLTSDTMMLARDLLDEVRLTAAFTESKPTSSKLPVNYQHVPSLLRDIVANVIGRIKRRKISEWAKFPAWPIDLSADVLEDLSYPTKLLSQTATPVLLTHDLDSAEGLNNLVDYFLDIEESVGAKSCNYIVPCSWAIPYNKLDIVLNRGHEIGIHGYDHSNKTPFLPEIERHQRLLAAEPLIKAYRVSGYRAPSLLRTKGLLHNLESFYRYDSSIPTSGGLFPIPNNGCATARPFKIGNLWEIPLSMPRDGSLQFLGYSCQEILDMWIACANLIAQSGGVINLLTHCEQRFSGKKSMREIYRKFLEYLASDNRFKFTLPKDLCTDLYAKEIDINVVKEPVI
ncbi:hypothetical protein AYO45_01175 [Gammaproteobacteria bacterium SCGC AG-212-F23]|nr:hypothetical protein AYO45_01175 [Gammaproteobacteria bacterium SCGC AG-212-F23]